MSIQNSVSVPLVVEVLGDSDNAIACILTADICHHTQTPNTSIIEIDKTMKDLQSNITDYTIIKLLYAAKEKSSQPFYWGASDDDQTEYLQA